MESATATEREARGDSMHLDTAACFDRAVETRPILSVDELLAFSPSSSGYARRPAQIQAPLPPRRRMLVCHDMKGNYLEDRFDNGGKYRDPFQLYHWDAIDVFVYFSHSFVTIPPRSWITACHKRNTLVLGTLITEWDEGASICAQLFESPETVHAVANKLAEIALQYGFDGWLINIENLVAEELIPSVQLFLAQLRSILHAVQPSALVLWYDSITCEGKLEWQDTLNEKNKPFFDVSDGIFTNYCWKQDFPQQCLAFAGDRQHDVYFGIDVFGRGTYGGGQYACDRAVNVIREADVSMALFAPGWVLEHEMGDRPATDENFEAFQQQYEAKTLQFWSPVARTWQCEESVVNSAFPSVVRTNFSSAVGKHVWLSAFCTTNPCSQYNPGMQGLCAAFPWRQQEDEQEGAVVTYDYDTGYDGFSSLRLQRCSTPTTIARLNYALKTSDDQQDGDLLVRVISGPAEQEQQEQQPLALELLIKTGADSADKEATIALDEPQAVAESMTPMSSAGSLHWRIRTFLLSRAVLDDLCGDGDATLVEVRCRKVPSGNVAALVGGFAIGPRRSIAANPVVSAACKGLTVENLEASLRFQNGAEGTELMVLFTVAWESFKLREQESDPTLAADFDAHSVDVLAVNDDLPGFAEACPFEQCQLLASHVTEATPESRLPSDRTGLRVTLSTSSRLASDPAGAAAERMGDWNFAENLIHVGRTDDTQCRVGCRVSTAALAATHASGGIFGQFALLLVPAEPGFQRPPLSACPVVFLSVIPD